MERKIIKLTPKLSPEQEKELKEIETKIRGDMTDEEWNFFKTIRA